jgi:hypothetical protein
LNIIEAGTLYSIRKRELFVQGWQRGLACNEVRTAFEQIVGLITVLTVEVKAENDLITERAGEIRLFFCTGV